MDPERLFLKTLEELEARIASPDEYDLLKAAGLLRLLLIEGQPLAQKAVRALGGERPLFRFGTISPDPMAGSARVFQFIADGLDPGTGRPGRPMLDGPIDAFLRNPVIINKGETFTVLDIIRAAANAEGGIHHDVAPQKKNAAVRHFSASLHVAGAPVGLQALRAIGRVTLKALAPLRQLAQKT